MKKIHNEFLYFVPLGLFLLVVGIVFQIPQTAGFNPSDDGVILAQAYRLVNGEIPHLDFISIRPVGSAVIHSLAFFLPGAFEVNARWIVYIQYILYSFIWAWILFRRLPAGRRNPWFMLTTALLIYVLNQNHYNLFPWTTIDALFFFSIGYFFFRRSRFGWGLFFATVSVLCRQTFALPFLFLLIQISLKLKKEKAWKKMLVSLAFGALPFLGYFILLAMHGAIEEFFRQMTGRTEFWETAVLKYWNSFWNSPTIVPWLVVTFALVFQVFNNHAKSNPLKSIGFLTLVRWFSIGAITLLTVLIFTDGDHLFHYSFSIFWLAALAIFVASRFGLLSQTMRSTQFWILLLAWTSSISLGDNAPVFATGILVGGVLMVSIKREWFIRFKPWMFFAVAPLLLTLFIYGQKKNNYRDLESSRLTKTAGEVFDGLGRIRTNDRTYDYLADIHRLYNELNQPEGHFVVLPNAPIIYPLLSSRNPLPLDWMQGAEMVGQEKQVINRLKELSLKKETIFLIDKFNSKLLSEALVPAEHAVSDYPFYDFFIDQTRELENIRSDWFEIRVWK